LFDNLFDRRTIVCNCIRECSLVNVHRFVNRDDDRLVSMLSRVTRQEVVSTKSIKHRALHSSERKRPEGASSGVVAHCGVNESDLTLSDQVFAVQTWRKRKAAKLGGRYLKEILIGNN